MRWILTSSGFSQWFLELWNTSHAVLGVIAVIMVQRCIFKILIAVFLSREFKHDETNRAWWTVSRRSLPEMMRKMLNIHDGGM
jgi:hypothetical protein